MHLIHVDEIQIPVERIRKEFDNAALRELRKSIEENGLFHPLLLRPDGRTLVAGERRFRVLREIYFEKRVIIFDGGELPLGQVPFVRMGENDELHYLEAEFHENSRRSALTWQEESLYIHRYHTLKKEINATHKQIDTAVQLHADKTGINQSLAIVPFLSIPEVANAKTREEGLKILERHLEKGHREAIARTLGTSTSGGLHRLMHGDMRKILPTLEASQFDTIIADPPYGVDADKWANMSAIQHAYKDSEEYSDELYQTIAIEGFRAAKPQAHAYLFCDLRRFSKVGEFLRAAGWRLWPWPFIFWRGASNGVCPWPEHGPRRTYECIAFAIKGDRRVTGVFPDVLPYSDTSGIERGAHKPVELYSDLIARSCIQGNTILDPCIGTGTIFDAATAARVHCTGIEIEAAAYAQAGERLK